MHSVDDNKRFISPAHCDYNAQHLPERNLSANSKYGQGRRHARMNSLSPVTKSFLIGICIFHCCKLGQVVEGRERSLNSHNNRYFVQIPYSNPPTVRPPPYTLEDKTCPAMNVRENWIDTLCGDLNTGYVPKNPLGHKFSDGGSYPFEVIKNKTLGFFRRALPVLKSDKSLPKVARYGYNNFQPQTIEGKHRMKRGVATRLPNMPVPAEPTPLLEAFHLDNNQQRNNVRRRRQGPGNRFCDNSLNYYNRLCKLYNAMWGKTPHMYQRDSMENRHYHTINPNLPNPNVKYPYMPRPGGIPDITIPAESTKSGKHINALERSPMNQADDNMPPTPCPSSAEYLTPVFARNHEGAWRYVVQIPREGYFTQTVEVTKCQVAKCYYMDGSCRTSPRWQSLLVAELYYPDAVFPTTPKPKSQNGPEPPNVGDFNKYQEYLYSRASSETGNTSNNGLSSSSETARSSKASQCDGIDDIGCFQVRLFYDWFLIPGSCKCWKPPFDFTFRSRAH